MEGKQIADNVNVNLCFPVSPLDLTSFLNKRSITLIHHYIAPCLPSVCHCTYDFSTVTLVPPVGSLEMPNHQQEAAVPRLRFCYC